MGTFAHTTRFAALTACVALAVGLGATAAGATIRDGAAAITKPDGTRISSGGSTKAFTLALPRGAACSGARRAHAKVYSYVVQHGTDLTGVTFAGIPSTGYGLVDATSGNYYGARSTADADGHLPKMPDFAWAPMLGARGASPTRADLLSDGSSGQWDAGIACVDPAGHVTNSWSVALMFIANHADPNGFTYCQVPNLPSELPEVPYSAALPFVGLAVVGGYVGIRRQRTRTRPDSTV